MNRVIQYGVAGGAGRRLLSPRGAAPNVEKKERVTAVEIYMWWLDLELTSKEWLREHLRASEVPPSVRKDIAAAGGPNPDAGDPVLTPADWDFIETQSEFVD